MEYYRILLCNSKLFLVEFLHLSILKGEYKCFGVAYFCYGRLIMCTAGKESICNAGDLGLTPGLGKSPGGGHRNPLRYSCLETPHRQRSLVSYSPWGPT